ncbi:MAG: recombinase family protein [Cyanobacteria bacterium P01_H01_bin.105]
MNIEVSGLDSGCKGCDRIFTDEGVSGAKSSRPEWDKCLDQLRKGDVLVIWKLYRAGRSTKHLIEVSEFLEFKGVELRSIQDQIDTSTAMGKFFFRTMASIAELERDIIKERTEAGLKAARARGRKGGRKKTVTKGQELEAKRLAEAGEMPITEICKQVGISRATYYRLVG